MTPKLTYTATFQPSGDVTIVLGEFTHERGQGLLFRATNGVSIRSNEYPEWIATLYVQGTFYQGDKNTIHIPAADWQRVKQALDEYGAVRTNAEAKKPPYRVVEDRFAYGIHGGEGCVAALSKRKGWTKAQADELCAKLNARADAERKATEVRVEETGDLRRLYIGDLTGGNNCVSIFAHAEYGLTRDQADQLATATAEALRGILRGEVAK